MNRLFTSDTHFFQKNIIKYCNRPFADFEEMNGVLVKNWNAVATDTTVLYHLGDVAMGDSSRWDELLKSLNGYKVLTAGNHDRIFAGEKPRQIAKWDEKYHEWFDEVWDHHEIVIGGHEVNLSHFPYDGDHTEKDRYSEFRLKDDGKILVHGHTHAEYAQLGPDARVSRSKAGTLQIHIGVDAWDFTPVPESEVLALIEANL